MAGFYKMYRGWLNHPALAGANEPFCRRAAWCWLIDGAAWQSNGDLDRGQLSASLRHLAATWRWSVGAVRRFLERLEKDGMIVAETGTGQMVITVCNYDIYQAATEETGTPPAQQPAQQPAHLDEKTGTATGTPKAAETLLFPVEPGTATGTPSRENRHSNRHTNRHNNIKKRKNLNIGDLEASFEAWWKHCPRKVGKGQARQAYRAALSKATAEALVEGILRYAGQVADRDGQFICHPSTWLRGERWLDQDATAPPSADDQEFDRAVAAAAAAGPEALRDFLSKQQETPR
ncbi:hypothetical protein [Oceanibaculum indicum]|uniref:Uncharacterized protein n=1 Tax=Oceanibaculum indicum P24 TaxID=1207063 RepID=K2JJJ8_9PROT|nr:hypothetical protein [Oceanibaculum indicum]EKE75513.1 hypothetical protein P24_09841 [Oceanibaculum indicum P24]